MPIAIVVGIPVSLRPRVERHVGKRVQVCVVPMKQDGGLRLESPPGHAARMISNYADQAGRYEDVLVLVLPYAHVPEEVMALVGTLADCNGKVVIPAPKTIGERDGAVWPPRSPRLDKDFQDILLRAICRSIDYHFPVGDLEHHEVACDVIRGLVVHSKMGPNNHSHEDDLWKSGRHDLGPGGREAVISQLMSDGILDRKKNKSQGGAGWVYWISDVEKAKAFCPHLVSYFK